METSSRKKINKLTQKGITEATRKNRTIYHQQTYGGASDRQTYDRVQNLATLQPTNQPAGQTKICGFKRKNLVLQHIP